jgi:hypothetical protein
VTGNLQPHRPVVGSVGPRRRATRSPAPSGASAWPRTARRSPTCSAPVTRASVRCCASVSKTPSPNDRSANASASRRCRPRASSATRSSACAPQQRTLSRRFNDVQNGASAVRRRALALDKKKGPSRVRESATLPARRVGNKPLHAVRMTGAHTRGKLGSYGVPRCMGFRTERADAGRRRTGAGRP